MDYQPPQFDDPDLRTMLKRSVGSETAPPALRQRVTAALGAEQRLGQRVRHGWQRPLYGIAAAAILLIGFGLTFTILFNKERAAPQWFAAAMVKTHGEYPAQAPTGAVLPTGVTGEDYPAISKALGDELGYAVLAKPLGDGWKLEGARLCVVGTSNAAQVVFSKGDQTVSLFSVSTKVLYYSDATKDGMNYSQIEQGHAVSGFVRGDAVHCLVASSKSGTPDLKALTRLREQLRAATP
jgi:hypothetical protein